MAAGLLVVALLVTATGCGESQGVSVARQKQELRAYAAQTIAWGDEILAWILPEEVQNLTPFYGGGRSTRDDYAEWPKYYVWERTVRLLADGPRSPTKLADDLDPWLQERGWIRARHGERPGDDYFFTRDYFRDGYHLALDIGVKPPPYAQNVAITIVSPDTHTKPKASM